MPQYELQNFTNGKVLTAEQLNAMDNAIYLVIQELDDYYSLESLIALTPEEILELCK